MFVDDIDEVEEDAELDAIIRNSLYGFAFGLDSGDILRFVLRRL